MIRRPPRSTRCFGNLGRWRRVLLIFYQYNDSVCVFYLRKTVDVAGDESHLIELLRERPGPYVLARLRQMGVPPLEGYREVWRSRGYKHPMVLLRAEEPV
jgi:hypothetical protein